MLIVVDPYADYKPIKEASYCNIPVIALCDTHNSLKYVDLAIPCNNNSTESISMIFWMLAREVLILRGELENGTDDWEVMVDLFYHKDINQDKDELDVDEEEEQEADSDEEGEGAEENAEEDQDAQEEN